MLKIIMKKQVWNKVEQSITATPIPCCHFLTLCCPEETQGGNSLLTAQRVKSSPATALPESKQVNLVHLDSLSSAKLLRLSKIFKMCFVLNFLLKK